MCAPPPQEAPITLDNLTILLSRESTKMVPQTFQLSFSNGGATTSERQVTNWPHPHPQVGANRGVANARACLVPKQHTCGLRRGWPVKPC